MSNYSPFITHTSRRITTIACVIAFAFFSRVLHPAIAEDAISRSTTIRVRVEAKPDPVRATGIVFSSSGSRQIEETTISKIGDKLFEIQFAIPTSSLTRSTVATAIAYDETNKASYANTTPISQGSSGDAVFSVPECPTKSVSNAGVLSGPGPLKQLVDFRSQRVALVREKVARLMDKSFLKRLQEFEKAFGLERTAPLSPELPAEELVERLSRLQHAIARSVTKYNGGARE